MLDHVERLIKNGVAVHLLKKKSKAPVESKWSEAPVYTLAQLKKAYRDGMNVGFRPGKPSEVHGLFLHVIDADIRDVEKTEEAFDTLGDYFPDYMNYPEVASGSGGPSRHFYFFSDKPFSSRKFAHSEKFQMVFSEKLDRDVKKWDWELHLLGTGGNIVLPPSIHPDTGKPYRWISKIDFSDLMLGEGPIVDSEELAELIGRPSGEEYDPDDEKVQPIGLDIETAEDWISKLPKDDWIEDRDGWLKLGMALHHEFKGSTEAFNLWCSCSKLSEKFDKKDQKRVWRSFKNKHRPFRMASIRSVVRDIELEEEFINLEDDFDDDMDATPKKKSKYPDMIGEVIVDEHEELKNTKRAQKIKKAEVEAELGVKIPKKVARLNKRFALVRNQGKTIVIEEKRDGEITYGNLTDLHSWHENDRVPTENATEPVTKWWLRQKTRREYREGIVFEPDKVIEGAYNLWRGWSVEADKAEDPAKRCRLFLKHIRQIICRNDKACYEYLIGWLAHMVQKPGEKPGVAVVMRGKKGAGKDTIAVYFSGILKRHYMMISQREHLVGKFNAHQEKLMFLHVEEGYWAGSKQDEGPLKSIITSPTVTIERKGVDAFQVNSVLRILMTSNEAWVVPASGEDERRYFVVDVDDAYTKRGRLGADRREYFNALNAEMINGGREALLAYLQQYDLSDFEVRDPPETAALDEQKLAGLQGVDRWWADQLMAGELAFDVFDLSHTHPADWTEDAVSTLSTTIYDAYSDWARKQRFSAYLSNVQFFMQLQKLVNLQKTQRRVQGDRATVVRIPALRQCRTQLDEHMGTKIEWHGFQIPEAEDIEPEDDMDL